jgi:hypothetical protein
MGFFPNGMFFLHKNFDKDKLVNQINIMEGPAAPPLMTGADKNHLVIIALGNRVAVYANEKPLVLVKDETWQAGTARLNFGVCSDNTDAPLQVRFDNLKVWDITGLFP